MIFLRLSHDFLMTLSQIFHDFLMIFYDFLMTFSWLIDWLTNWKTDLLTDLLNATDLTVCNCHNSLELSELAMVCAVSALVYL